MQKSKVKITSQKAKLFFFLEEKQGPVNGVVRFLYYWLPVVVWAAFIFYLSNQPGLKSGFAWPYDFILRKIAHIIEFAVLFLLLLRALEKGHSFTTKKALAWAFVLTIFYAVSDEYHQSFVAQRVASLADVIIDSLGVSLLIWWRIQRFS